MAGGVYILVLLVLLATVGRLSVPRRERTALRTWTLRDVYYNVRRGLAVLGAHGPSYPALHEAARPAAQRRS
ncbi:MULTISPECIES: hypothetical protein [unclassified Kocuria]|uniref:hypothetical protein n=1 Tax=unclassified Kocuria TaxID=2649579 RepID=UPI00064AC8F6|nr:MULTISPECIES: hypothetical protein [unclassified Kocuria]KLU08010.1 hypothetical protein ABL57_20420 [Kocuria sp. SM24M-10]OLT08581.1 hypothetical protein BJF77_12420 [Kocuria sp. CNJ-770]